MSPVSFPRLFMAIGAISAATALAAQVVTEPAVIDAVAAGRVRVNVELRLARDFTPEGDLSVSDASAQRDDIAAAQRAVLAALKDSDARIVRQHTTVPFLTLEIGARALADLRAFPERVIRIQKESTVALAPPPN